MNNIIKIKLEAAADTDQGLARDTNQDTIYHWVSEPDITPPRALLIIADGMGGHQEGEVASQLAVESQKEILLPELSKKKIDKTNFMELMRSAVDTANESIYNYAVDNDIIPQDIGTTLDCVVIIGIEAFVTHIGDGRIYMLDKNGLSQLTSDHSAVAEMVSAGILDPEDIYTHPKRNILTQGLGGNVNLEFEVEKYNLPVGGRILMCSDGLWGLVRNPLLERVLLWASPPNVVVKELIVAANEAGGEDNISVIVCDILPA
jgi:serine/threonine protein phosphatase PrpC